MFLQVHLGSDLVVHSRWSRIMKIWTSYKLLKKLFQLFAWCAIKMQKLQNRFRISIWLNFQFRVKFLFLRLSHVPPEISMEKFLSESETLRMSAEICYHPEGTKIWNVFTWKWNYFFLFFSEMTSVGATVSWIIFGDLSKSFRFINLHQTKQEIAKMF